MTEIVKYRQLHEDDFEEIYNVAFEAWSYTYKDIVTSSYIKNSIDKFYSPEVLQKHNLFYLVLDCLG